MRRDVIGLVTPDLVLRVILAGVVRVALVVEIPGVDLDDGAADVASFRVPGDVIADFELGWHGGEGMDESVVMREVVWLLMHPGALCPFQLKPTIETMLNVKADLSIAIACASKCRSRPKRVRPPTSAQALPLK